MPEREAGSRSFELWLWLWCLMGKWLWLTVAAGCHILLLIMMIMSEAQRSDIKGKWEAMAGSDKTKKVACALCRNFVEILSTWLKIKNNELQTTTLNAERGMRTSNSHSAAPVACSLPVAFGLWSCDGLLVSGVLRMLRVPVCCMLVRGATRYCLRHIRLRTCRYVVQQQDMLDERPLGRLNRLGDASSTGPPVRSRSGGAVGPVDRTGPKIEPGPQP